jgi:hypothetical protein
MELDTSLQCSKDSAPERYPEQINTAQILTSHSSTSVLMSSSHMHFSRLSGPFIFTMHATSPDLTLID